MKSGRSVDIVVTPTDDHRSYHVSSEKIRRDLGFVAGRTVKDAIVDLKDGFLGRQGAERDDRRPLLQHQAHAGSETEMNKVEFLENNEAAWRRHTLNALVGDEVVDARLGRQLHPIIFSSIVCRHCLRRAMFPHLPRRCRRNSLSSPVQTMSLTSGHMPRLSNFAGICARQIHLIDHLITDGNYSTTITLAYTEEVRAAGAAMVDTCFFFLVSDYIVADGSLAQRAQAHAARDKRGCSSAISRSRAKTRCLG